MDRKHSVFGEVVDGEKILEKMEKVATDKKDRPLQPIKILSTEILVDPAKEAEEKEYTRLQGLAEARKEAERGKKAGSTGKNFQPEDGRRSKTETNSNATIGKYLPKAIIQSVDTSADCEVIPAIPAPKMKAKKAKTKTHFGNFSSW